MKKLLTALTFYFCVILLHAQGTLLDSKALANAKRYESLEEALKEPLKVYKLNLSGQGLKQLPAEIGQLKNLQVLNCSDNQLKSLAGIEKLTSLTELSCRGNQLKSLAGIEKLTSLTEVSCSNNQLKSLAGIEQLASLTYLICDSNQLTSLSGIEQLTSLRVLYCSYNQLTTLIGIKKLTSLASLYCADNQLTNLVGIEKLTSLTKLDCSYNQLISLSGVEQLTSLTKLECFANQLTSLSGIEKLTSLTKLYCSENKLITLPKEIGKLEKLSEVDFQNQKQNDFSKVDLQNMYKLYRDVYRVQKIEKDSLTIYQNDYTKLTNEKKLSYIWTLCRKFEGYTSDFDRYKDGQEKGIKTNNNEIQMAMEEGILEGKASLGRLMQKMLLIAQPLVISNKDIAAKAVFAYFMGVAHEAQNNWKEATASYQEWLNLRKKEGDKTKIRIALNNNIKFTLRAYQYYQENPSIKVDYPYTTAEEFADEYYKNAQGQTYTTTNSVRVEDTKIIEKELTQVGKVLNIPFPADSVALKEGLELEVVMPHKTALDPLNYEVDVDSLMHVYDKGETLESIAKMYSVSLQELLKENPSIKTNKDLKEGQEI
ncbi:MAG: LysM peptidoglycan-binding domain-containing protein, partial [Cytophagales bacterium]